MCGRLEYIRSKGAVLLRRRTRESRECVVPLRLLCDTHITQSPAIAYARAARVGPCRPRPTQTPTSRRRVLKRRRRGRPSFGSPRKVGQLPLVVELGGPRPTHVRRGEHKARDLVHYGDEDQVPAVKRLVNVPRQQHEVSRVLVEVAGERELPRGVLPVGVGCRPNVRERDGSQQREISEHVHDAEN